MHASVEVAKQGVSNARSSVWVPMPSGVAASAPSSEPRRDVRRAIEVFRWRGETMLATRHVPVDGSASTRVGLLLLNAGPAPRAGNSDLSVRIADRVATAGFCSLRLDVPGVGDSTGRSYQRLAEFRLAAQDDPLDDVVAEVVEQACARHGVERFLVGGLCAGAVVSLRGARRMGRRCAGLVLLEPDLLDARIASGMARAGVRASIERALRGLERRRWSSACARLTRGVYEHFERGRMPDGVSRDLVDAWITLAEARVPTFLAVAEGLACDTLCSRIALAAGMEVQDVAAGEKRSAPSGVTYCRLGGTNHLFTAGEAPERIPETLAAWALRFA